MGRPAIAIALVAACGGSGGGSVAPGDIEDYVTTTYCEHLTRCGIFDSVAVCLASRASDFKSTRTYSESLAAAVAAGTVTWDGAATAACYRALLDPPSCDADAMFRPVAACNDRVAGSVAAGGDCTLDEECVSQQCDRLCADGSACCAGTCAAGDPRVIPELGGTCRVTSGTSTSTTTCIDSQCGPSNTCEPYAELGDACGAGTDCHPGKDLVCNAGACAKADGSCGQDLACPRLGQRCDETTMQCATPGLPGDSCATDLDCEPAYRCDAAAGTCANRALYGEACTQGRDCRDRGYCDAASSTCAPPQAAGAPCTSDDQCDGVCAATNTCVDSSSCRL